MDELHEKMSKSELSKELGGDRGTHSAQWVDFRKVSLAQPIRRGFGPGPGPSVRYC